MTCELHVTASEDCIRIRLVRIFALLVSAMMLLGVLIVVPTASSDPTVTDNLDCTKSVTWEFDDPSDYALADAQISDGRASIARSNESDLEDTSADFAAGTLSNIDITKVPGSLVLDDTSTTYQVTIQPGALEGIDTYLSEDKVNDNQGGDKELRIDSESGRRHHMLFKFDFATVPSNAVITRASIELYQLAGSKGGTLECFVGALVDPFDEMTTTWLMRDATNPWAIAGGDFWDYVYGSGEFEALQTWWSVDISKLVERWVTGTLANHGLIIVPVMTVVDNVKVFQSSDQTGNPQFNPRLIVNYTIQGGVGAYESSALGPGTKANFTLLNWYNSTASFLSDEFSGASLASKWSWLNNPFGVGGEYDVGLTLPGVLHVEGGTFCSNTGGNVGSNYVHQEVVGDFRATTYLTDSFTTDGMGAGILLMENDTEWISIEKAGPSGTAVVQVVVCEASVATVVASADWSGRSDAYLRIVRAGMEIKAYSSPDGSDFTLMYTHNPVDMMMIRLDVGVFVYSSVGIVPVVNFDYFRVVPLNPTTMDIRVRVGNSTDLLDPSWGSWSTALPGSSSHVLNQTAKYMQYRIYIRTWLEWYSPSLNIFRCYYEYYPNTGAVTTADFVPLDFSAWISVSASGQAPSGVIRYWYSFDSGLNWYYAGTGGTYSISSGTPKIRLRAEIETYDSLSTPTVDYMSARYGRALSSFYMETPSQVVAGTSFQMIVYAKDAANRTLWPWSGTLQLTAMDQSGTGIASDVLDFASAVIASDGYVTIPAQSYDTAETITIRASATGVSGLSEPIQVVPGPINSITILPEDRFEVYELSNQTFSANALDVLGNVISGASFSWSVDPDVGTLNSNTGTSVTLAAGEVGGTGDLVVTSAGVTETRTLTVVRSPEAPQIYAPIPTQVRDEDSGTWTVDLSNHVTDEYYGLKDLRWYVTGEELVKASGENRTGNMVMSFSPLLNMWGEDELQLVVVDPDGLTAVADVMVQINPVNDAPMIDVIDSLVVHFDVVYMFNMRYHVQDVDNTYDELTLTVDAASAQYVEVERLTLAINYPESLNDTVQSVQVTVSDGNLSSWTTIMVEVSDNGVPVIRDNLPPVEMYQGESLIHFFDLDDYFVDPDHDMLYYTTGEEHITVEICPDNRVSFYAGYDWAGTEYVLFNAIDPRGARAESPCKVTVLPINQPPSIEGVPDLMVKYDELFEFDLTRYITDADDPADTLDIVTDNQYIAVAGVVLAMQFPASTDGQSFNVTITVSDEEFSDNCSIWVTVSDNSPPKALQLPSHSFHEDVEIAYPTNNHLEWYFEDDEDEGNLTFEVFPWTAEITAQAQEYSPNEWKINFIAEENYHGVTAFTVRATDAEGALTEVTVDLTVTSVPDAPTIVINESVVAEAGFRVPVDLTGYVSDVDTPLSNLRFSVAGAGSEYVTALVGMLILDFPEEFVENAGESRFVYITVIVMDAEGLTDSAVLEVEVHRSVSASGTDGWTYWAMLLLGGTAFGLFFVAMNRRKRPFVITDMMLIHNDGFLIGRAAERHEGEIDEDILSGMLTAVLNFVEDSMSTSEDSLKTFGFKEYKVMVHRASMTYAAVVYEGDPPDDIEEKLEEFLAKAERIYRKRMENWTGDMSVDFAGVEVLLETFVRENSKKHFFSGNGPDVAHEAPTEATEQELPEPPPPPETEAEPVAASQTNNKTRKLRASR